MEFTRMLSYCAALEANNDRQWFHENHDRYEEAKGDFLRLLDELRYAVADAAPELGGGILYMDQRDWMFRIARDMRFYQNRPPYQPSFRAYIAADRKSWLPIGYFLCVAPGQTLIGTGMWLEETADINRVRDYIALHLTDWEQILRENRLTLSGDRLKTVPRGYDPASPAAQWLRFKNWVTEFDFPDETLTTTEAFCDAVRPLIRRMEPLRQFLLDAGSSIAAASPELPKAAKQSFDF